MLAMISYIHLLDKLVAIYVQWLTSSISYEFSISSLKMNYEKYDPNIFTVFTDKEFQHVKLS